MNVSLSDLPGFFYDRQLIEGIDNAMSTYSFMLWKYLVLFVLSANVAPHDKLTCVFFLLDLENMKLWPAIIAQLNNEHAEIRKGVAWVCGTAVQNNPKAQKAVCI